MAEVSPYPKIDSVKLQKMCQATVDRLARKSMACYVYGHGLAGLTTCSTSTPE